MRRLLVLLLVVAAFAAGSATAQDEEAGDSSVPGPKPEIVSFPSNGLTLKGFLYKPPGDGPFPAMLWNHGSAQMRPDPPQMNGFAQWYLKHGFALFLPHRRGHGLSPGDWIVDLEKRESTMEARHRKMVELQDAVNADVVAALDYLKTLRFVDRSRIYVSGVSYGGIQTLLTAEKNVGIRAAIPFAPGAMSWEQNRYIRDRLVLAARNRKVPIYLIQAENDFDLAPSRVLGPELASSPLPWAAKVYPAYGTSHQDGHHGFATTGRTVWGEDVLRWIESLK